MRRKIGALAVLVAGALGVAGVAWSSGATMDRAESAAWDCNPKVLILGYYHCAPPGKASVLDLVTGVAAPASLQVRVFRPDGTFAGTETLLRADLYAGQPCRQEGLDEWALLDLPVDYRACHNFAA